MNTQYEQLKKKNSACATVCSGTIIAEMKDNERNMQIYFLFVIAEKVTRKNRDKGNSDTIE